MDIEKKFEEKESTIKKLNKSKRTIDGKLKDRNSESSLSVLHDESMTTSKTSKSNKPKYGYKSIMCPLGNHCPNDCRPRWPSTETGSIRKLGHSCPYAHHYSELHFAYIYNNSISQEDFSRIRGIADQVAKIKATIEADEGKSPWIPGSNLRPCDGCGTTGEKRKPCNTCQLNGLTKQKMEKYNKATKEANKKLMNTKKQMLKEYTSPKNERLYI